MKRRYAYIELTTQDGEIYYNHRVLTTFSEEEDIEEVGQEYVRTFWGGWGETALYDESSGEWTCDGDNRIVSLTTIKEITLEQYNYLHQLFYN